MARKDDGNDDDVYEVGGNRRTRTRTRRRDGKTIDGIMEGIAVVKELRLRRRRQRSGIQVV